MTAEPARWRFDAIGTAWEIETAQTLPPAVRAAVLALVEDFDAGWSRFRDDSLVGQLAAGAPSVPLPPDAAEMLAVYAELADATAGAVDPLVGDSLSALGYDAAYTLRAGTPRPVPDDVRSTLRWDGGRLALASPATVDVGALGKGRLVDRVLTLLRSHVAGGIVVDASGDLAVSGSPQRIALEHPYDPTRAIGVYALADGALCASAGNRRAWGDGLHHVIDARTGRPVETVVATWAVHPDAMHADALATALFFDGGTTLAEAWGADWVRMTADGRVQAPTSTQAELFLATAGGPGGRR